MQYINIPAGTTYPLILGDEVSAMNTAKIYLLCDTSSGAGAINILLPRITNGDNSLKNWWFEIFINDIGNNASVNNIKITPNPADKINGSGAQITLNANGVTGRIVVTSKTAWDFNIGAGSSGGGDTIENGTFNINANGTQTIPTLKRAKLIFFNAKATFGLNTLGSDGRSDGSGITKINNCVGSINTGAMQSDQNNCIAFDDGGGASFTSTVTNVSNNSFDVSTANLLGGITAVVQWHAITG